MTDVVISSDLIDKAEAALNALKAGAKPFPPVSDHGQLTIPSDAARPRPMFGVYPGAAYANQLAFEAKLGRKVEIVAVHAGRNGYNDWNTSWQGRALNLANPAIDKWSFPLFPDGAGMIYTAALAQDPRFLDGHRRAAQNALAAAPPENLPIYYRIGEEQNANWMAWAAAKGGPHAFKVLFRAARDVIKSVSARFQVVWCPIIGFDDFVASYPGDEAVDVIGFDVYCNSWDGQTFELLRDHPAGLTRLAAFAQAHGKPLACDEWGVSDDQPSRVAFVSRFLAWCEQNQLVYQIYFYEHPQYTLANKPNAWAAYRAAMTA